jgi:endonuclease I
MHHLFPTASHANSTRGNFPFGDVLTVKQTPCAGAVLGNIQGDERTYYFEPPLPQKGNTARAIFYFSIRYQLPVSAAEEASLKAWNRLDPVDEAERQRNDKIFNKQKDRNPFIDYPELVELISDF